MLGKVGVARSKGESFPVFEEKRTMDSLALLLISLAQAVLDLLVFPFLPSGSTGNSRHDGAMQLIGWMIAASVLCVAAISVAIAFW